LVDTQLNIVINWYVIYNTFIFRVLDIAICISNIANAILKYILMIA